ncbi:protein-glutamine gamma-glutamyltransferase [Halobacillus sp. Marseille-Q1614]|uniref:protein-glutamine gamma-glutamyltransferase n=1 Tax=Halobacillus sp. Marseille-Q1614 TaxID=2709134 RepID=UPI00156D98CD|nr:protein-glutamine gamma-glutamyltransferase [Halobacillus sp. Marseille-Q1614]
MIYISGSPFQLNDNDTNSDEKMIIQAMHDSPAVFSYPSRNEFNFEVKMRKNIMLSADAMNQSKASFTDFANSVANPQYWSVTPFGGFQLLPGVSPSAAILDIFNNGSRYAFECAGAMLMIFYRAALLSIGERNFNRLFQGLYIYSWHADSDLGLNPVNTRHLIPGDVVYFDNPQFDPAAPYWRGENAVFLGNDSYFGHGLGVLSSKGIIDILNDLRAPGAFQSAYLTELVVRPSFSHLARFAVRVHNFQKIQLPVILHNESSIPFNRYHGLLFGGFPLYL